MEDIIIPNFTLIRQSSYICSLNLDLEHRGLTSTEKGERELRGEFSFQLIFFNYTLLIMLLQLT